MAQQSRSSSPCWSRCEQHNTWGVGVDMALFHDLSLAEAIELSADACLGPCSPTKSPKARILALVTGWEFTSSFSRRF